MGRTSTSLEIFAATAPGLEGILARELNELGVHEMVADTGGVGFRGTLADVQRTNLHLRTASRVVVRLAAFRATAFHELERGARRVPWGDFVSSGQATRLRVTCRKSRLYHSGAVAQRVAEAIGRVTGSAVIAGGADPDDDIAEEEPAGIDDTQQLFVVRIQHDRVTISADSSGDLLHRRGYRLAVGKAPLRETLAAAMVMESGWTPGLDLIDPFCGSGTIAIEAALIARKIAPGLLRARAERFAFLNWASFDSTAWRTEVEKTEDAVLATPPANPLEGFDRDAGAIEAAHANAERAGVAADLRFERRTMSALVRDGETGFLVTNPPYGVRLGDQEKLRDLYDALGSVLRERFAGWTVGMLSTGGELERRMRLPFARVFSTQNGGIAVRFITARIT